MKKLAQVLREVDPNLNIVSPHRRGRKRTTRADWDNAAGVKCSTCGREIFRTHGPLKQCLRCLYREKGTWLEEIECPKCKARAAKVVALAEGLQTIRVICSECGTYAL